MNLSKIITISGKSGLFNVVAQAKNAVIVESLIDKKRQPVYSSTKVVSLDEISIFTTDEDKPLKEILLKIFDKEGGKQTPDIKSDNNALQKYFEEILPEYDKERVYMSDIKKLISWYNLLVSQNLIDHEEPVVEATQTEEIKKEEPVVETTPQPKPKKEKQPAAKTEKKEPKAKKK